MVTQLLAQAIDTSVYHNPQPSVQSLPCRRPPLYKQMNNKSSYSQLHDTEQQKALASWN